MSRIEILKLKNMFTIKKEDGDDFFIATSNSICISSFNLFSLIKFMLFRELISPKSLQGVIDEYYNATK